MPSNLSDKELRRCARQTILPEIGERAYFEFVI